MSLTLFALQAKGWVRDMLGESASDSEADDSKTMELESRPPRSVELSVCPLLLPLFVMFHIYSTNEAGSEQVLNGIRICVEER